MKLSLKRDQEEIEGNIFRKSKVVYYLSAKLELTDEETEWMKKYKLMNDILLTLSQFQEYDKHKGKLTISALLAGLHYESEEVVQLCDIERELRNSCEVFKASIEIRKSYCGEEVIDF